MSAMIVVDMPASRVPRAALLAVALISGSSCHRGPRRVAPLPRAKSLGGPEMYWTAQEIVLEPMDPPPEAGVDGRTFVEALDEEVRAWNVALDSCHPAPRLAVGALRVRGFARDDGHNVVALLSSWCPADRRGIQGCYDPAVQAMTHVRTRHERVGSPSGEIREADVEINGVNFRWSLDGEPAGTRSLRAILGHELGHVLGLNHSCPEEATAQGNAGTSACSPRARLSIMYPDPTETGRAAVLFPGEDAIETMCSAGRTAREPFEALRPDP